MKMKNLLITQRILLINWIIVPLLGASLWAKSGLNSALLFVLFWLFSDRIWDWLTGLLTAGVARIGANEKEATQMEFSDYVPDRMAAMMIVDLLGTILLPWIIAGLLLLS